MNILIVDDNELNLRAVARIFRALHQVRTAATASEAMAEVKAHRPDVIVCDFELALLR